MQRKARGVPFGRSKQATSNAALRPNYPPSLRVASKCGACGVALLAKGTTLGFVARLAVIRIWRQRVSCGGCQQTLETLHYAAGLHCGVGALTFPTQGSGRKRTENQEQTWRHR